MVLYLCTFLLTLSIRDLSSWRSAERLSGGGGGEWGASSVRMAPEGVLNRSGALDCDEKEALRMLLVFPWELPKDGKMCPS